MIRKTLIFVPTVDDDINKQLVKELIANIKETTNDDEYELMIDINPIGNVVKPINKGLYLAMAKGYDFVNVADDIRWSDKDWLKKLRNAAYENSLATAFASHCMAFNQKANELVQYKCWLWGFVFVPLETIRDIGVFDENFCCWGMEKDYSVRLVTNGLAGTFVQIIGLQHLHCEGTTGRLMKGTAKEDLKKQDEEYYQKKWVLKNVRT